MMPNQADGQAPQWQQMMSKALPGISTGLTGVGNLVGGISQANALRSNATSYTTEGLAAARQGSEQEAQQRRAGAATIGSMTAAAGQAGTGYQGSNGRMIAQSAANTELDALNIRYKSQLQKWSYFSQSSNLRSEASAAQGSGIARAGAALLKGYSGNYTGMGIY